MAKTKNNWDWGRFNPDRCGEFVVGNRMAGARFYVTSCHRTKASATKRLKVQTRALASVKGLHVQLRDKSSGQIIKDTTIKGMPRTKKKTPKKAPKGFFGRFMV